MLRMKVCLFKTPSLVRHVIFSPAGRAFIISACCWVLAFQYCRYQYWRDPHSAFFKSDHVYDLQYSALRESQANDFIEQTVASNTTLRKSEGKPEICAAFVTVKRDTKQYVDAAIGSLLEGLTEEERKVLYVYVLFANPEPTVHPTWKQPWVENAVDKAETYAVKNSVLEHLKELERKRAWHEKGVFDYTYALEACYQTGASYVLMLEDDIIIADSWFARTYQALQTIDRDSNEGGEFWNWLYIRLFFTETSMHWRDTDFWYYHMLTTFFLASLSGFVILVLVRFLFPSTRCHLDNWAIAVLCLSTIPAFVALTFMIGKYSLFPPNGVFKMNIYGCCTQALLFPRSQIPDLLGRLNGIGIGQTDTMIEDYADETGKERLALSPQMVQHVGLESSRDNTLINSQSTWAFWFETYDAERLRADHDRLIKEEFME